MRRFIPVLIMAWWMIFEIRQSDAQYVTIPDAGFVAYLNDNGYGSCITGNQMDTTCPLIVNAVSFNASAAAWYAIENLDGIQYFDNLDTLSITLQSTLTTIPAFPPSLIWLQYSVNPQVVNFPPLPSTLKTFLCQNNEWTSLPPLPADLERLYCGVNQLTSLPVLPQTLTHLSCGFNQLTTLPDLPVTLVGLSSGNNQLTSLPALPPHLDLLYVYNNGLSELPPLPDSLSGFRVDSNPQLQCMPPLMKFTGASANFKINGTSIFCLSNIIEHTGYIPAIDTMPVCDIINSNGCVAAWNILGKVHHDIITDCQPMSEPLLKNVKVNLSNNGNLVQQLFTNAYGQISFLQPADTYDLSIDTTGLPLSVVCPTNNIHSSVLTASNPLDTAANFGLQCQTGLDVGVGAILYTNGVFVTNQVVTIAVHAGDMLQHYGTTCSSGGVSGVVTVTVGGPGTIVGASNNGVVLGNAVTWDIVDFSQVDFEHDFVITVHLDSLGGGLIQDICFTASANAAIDNNPTNNILTQCYPVLSSFDPNVKEVYPDNWFEPNNWHTYTIHFQNTGTAAAENIVVKDTLDQNLDWSSFQLLAYSHDNLTQVKGNVVHFNFPNINLPDSTSNEPESHGYIQYKIKTKSDIQPGTTIHNTAAIYFDFNAPVITNDAVVTYCLPIETQQSFDICPGDSVQVGSNVYHQAGTYTNLFTSASGCDSSIVTTVTVSAIDATITQSNATLTATSAANSYQWINCDNNQPIAEATNPVFTATSNGNYAVELTYDNGCVTKSACVDVTSIGIAPIHQGVLNVYPNPSNRFLYIDADGRRGVITVYNPVGQLIHRTAVAGEPVAFENLPAGMLSIIFVSDDGIVRVEKAICVR